MSKFANLCKSLLVPAIAAALVLSSQTPSQASTTSTTFNVSMTITASCTVSATALTFGSSGIIAANVDNTSTVTVTCTNSTPYDVGLDAGIGSGATVAAREMTSGGAIINYTMYQDPTRTIVWGNTIGTNTCPGAGNGSAQALTVYGRVPAQSTPAPGAYNDTINVTVTF